MLSNLGLLVAHIKRARTVNKSKLAREHIESIGISISDTYTQIVNKRDSGTTY